MRLLVDCRHISHPNPSGIGEYTIQLLAALFSLPHELDYVLLTTGAQKPDLLILMRDRLGPSFVFPTFVRHVHVSIPNKWLNARMLLTGKPTLDTLAGEPIDAVFLPNLNITPLTRAVPVFLTIHDLSWHFFPHLFSWRMRLWHKLLRPFPLMQRAQTLLVPSEITAKDVTRSAHIPTSHIAIIPHGLGKSFGPRPQARDHGIKSKYKLPKQFALFVGTIEPRKNIETVVEAVKHYRAQTNDDLHVVIVGKWGWKSHTLRRRLWKADVKTWVHTLDYLPTEDLPALYRLAHVFIWPSLYEGFGLPVLEAMASGTPVITSHIASMPELTGSAAILIDPFNIRDLTEALLALRNSPVLYARLKHDGLARAAEFSWKRAAEQTREIFKTSLN